MEKKFNNYSSPLRYPGGKGCLFKFMSAFLEENHLTGIDYAEPYAGGAGLALKLLMNGRVGRIHINDKDLGIYAFWTTLLQQPDDLCSWIEQVPVTIGQWQAYHEALAHIQLASIWEQATTTFFLNRTNISGILSGGPIGGLQQTGKYTLNARFNKTALIHRIRQIQPYADRIHLTRLDGVDFIRSVEARHGNTLLYLDPPYYKKAQRLYTNAFKEEDHVQLARCLQSVHCPWLLSYDHHAFVLGLYPEQRKILYQLTQCTSNRVGDELLVLDNRLQCQTSLSLLNQALLLG